MIYICKGCSSACEGICALCCKLPCKACSRCCRECCECLHVVFHPILRGPLGPYVMATWVVMLVASIAAIYGYTQADCSDAETGNILLLVVAAIHALFATYIQRRIIWGLAVRNVEWSSGQVAKEAVNIGLYDIGFCLYFFFFIGALCFCFYSMSMLSCGGSTGWIAVICLLVYKFCAPYYILFWYCGNCCIGRVTGRTKVVTIGTATRVEPAKAMPQQVGKARAI